MCKCDYMRSSAHLFLYFPYQGRRNQVLVTEYSQWLPVLATTAFMNGRSKVRSQEKDRGNQECLSCLCSRLWLQLWQRWRTTKQLAGWGWGDFLRSTYVVQTGRANILIWVRQKGNEAQDPSQSAGVWLLLNLPSRHVPSTSRPDIIMSG